MEDAPTELRTFDPYDILGVRNPGLRMTVVTHSLKWDQWNQWNPPKNDQFRSEKLWFSYWRMVILVIWRHLTILSLSIFGGDEIGIVVSGPRLWMDVASAFFLPDFLGWNLKPILPIPWKNSPVDCIQLYPYHPLSIKNSNRLWLHSVPILLTSLAP